MKGIIQGSSFGDIDWGLDTKVNVNEDFNDDLIELTSFLEDEEDIEDVFDGKFYISYLGLNPLTVYKENIDNINAVIYANYDKNKLNFLSKDLDNFIKSMSFVERGIRKEYVSKKDSNKEKSKVLKKKMDKIDKITLEMREKVQAIKGIVNVMSFDISVAIPKRKETVSVVEIIRESNLQDEIIKYATTKLSKASNDDVIKRDIDERIGVLEGLINSIDTLLKTTETLQNAKERVITLYKSRQYEYQQDEYNALKELRFPMVLAGKEHLIKNNVNEEFNVNSTNATIVLVEWHEIQIYKMYNIYNCMSKELTLDKFY